MAREKDTFLVASYLKAPKDPKKSAVKGYINNDDNISYREKVTVTRGLKDRDLTAGIILNLTQKTVHKCRFEGKNDWETLAAYYAKSYPSYFKLIDPPKPVDLSGEELISVAEDGDLVLADTEEKVEEA